MKPAILVNNDCVLNINNKGGFFMPNQEIKCSVEGCRFNEDRHTCGLSQITVGDMGTHASQKTDTECDSFQAR